LRHLISFVQIAKTSFDAISGFDREIASGTKRPPKKSKVVHPTT
jgi:hypothetical protein